MNKSLIEKIIHSKQSDEAFFQNICAKEMQHIKGFAKDFDAMFNWKSMEHLVNNQVHLSWPDFRVFFERKSNKYLPVEDYTQVVPYFVEEGGQVQYKRMLCPKKLQLAKSKGASFVIADAQNLDSGLRKFQAELTDYFNEQVNIVIYYSQKGKNTYGPHFDGEEVLVLQLEGEKKWYFYGFSDEQPLLEQKAFNQNFKPKVKQTVLAKKGDFIYVPRGLWHSAESVTSASLSLGISITCKTNYHLCKSLLEDIVIPNLTMDVFLRGNLPVNVGAKGSKGYEAEKIKKLAPELKKRMIAAIENMSAKEWLTAAQNLQGRKRHLKTMNDTEKYPIHFSE
jgi:Cupin superfamily protein